MNIRKLLGQLQKAHTEFSVGKYPHMNISLAVSALSEFEKQETTLLKLHYLDTAILELQECVVLMKADLDARRLHKDGG